MFCRNLLQVSCVFVMWLRVLTLGLRGVLYLMYVYRIYTIDLLLINFIVACARQIIGMKGVSCYSSFACCYNTYM